MKVLIANYRYFVSSGPERYLFNITRHLEERGHHVMPFSITYAKNVESPYAKYFVPPLAGEDEVYFDQQSKTPKTIARTLSRLFYSPEVERAVGRMIDETRPDIAYVLYYLRKMSPSLLVGIKKRSIPLVVRISDYGAFCPELHCLRNEEPCTLCQHGNIWPSVRHRCVKGSLPMSALEAAARLYHRMAGFYDLIDKYVVTNAFMLEMMVEAGYPREKLVCLPTFTDTNRFSPPETGASRDYIVCLGRLDRPKGIPVLLDALALLRDRNIAVPHLKIAGAGHNQDYVAQLKARVARLNLDEKVEFMGNLPPEQVPDLLRGAKCAVLPALWFENLPNTLVESMACGTPVVASDIGSLAVCVQNGIDGYLAEPGNPASLAEQLARVCNDPVEMKRLSYNCRQTALTTYSPEAHTEGLLDLFSSLRAEVRRRPSASNVAAAQ